MRHARSVDRPESERQAQLSRPSGDSATSGKVTEENRDGSSGKTIEPPRTSKRVLAGVTTLAALVGVMGSMVTTFFLLKPDLAPSKRNHAEIKKVRIEPEVTLEEYLSHPSIRSAVELLETSFPEATRRVLQQAAPRLGTVGTVVHYEFEAEGLRGGALAGRWILFDADTRRRLADSADLDPLPLAFDIDKSEMDLGSWESWVDTSSTPGWAFVVRIELYSEENGSRITFQDSEPFTAAGASPTPAWAGAVREPGGKPRSAASLPQGIVNGDIVETSDGLLWFVWENTKTRIWSRSLPEQVRFGRDATGRLIAAPDPMRASDIFEATGRKPDLAGTDGIFVAAHEDAVVHPIVHKRLSMRAAESIPTLYGVDGWSPMLQR